LDPAESGCIQNRFALGPDEVRHSEQENNPGNTISSSIYIEEYSEFSSEVIYLRAGFHLHDDAITQDQTPLNWISSNSRLGILVEE
jgi:hypothetical protein